MSDQSLSDHFHQLKNEATKLAGGLTDLEQRATVYRHLFLASGRNHAFPLIAAHGALWAGGYFRSRLRLGRWLALPFIAQPRIRQARLKQLAEFADVFRDVNRRVCIDTYVNFHFTRRFGHDPAAARFVPPELLDALNQIHSACSAGIELPDAAKRDIFAAHFLHEQQNVVGPTITNAVEQFDWPLVRWLALQPTIRFAYFPDREHLSFRNFANRDERILNGFKAFDFATCVGWDRVHSAQMQYATLPAAFFESPVAYFEQMKTRLLPVGS